MKKGDKFNRLTAIKEVGKKHGHPIWLFECECGNRKEMRASLVSSNKSKSCGCLAKELTIKRSTIHGGEKTRLYGIWRTMKQRCTNPNAINYKIYGGRGIRVCDEWNEFPNFRSWALSNGYEETLTIEREDVNKGYEPENCSWITRAEQTRNTRTNMKLTINNETKCMAEWCRVYGKKKITVMKRIARGMDPIDALTKPVQKYKKKDGN
ncbi:hypothetical protein [Bacillus sp. BP-3]|uniref:hypothetical protein n=1 Tax=Bacillus sp. BP-3 TaxID=3022773 RepID=UPI00232C6134|nr:hypothetical protein [Bacillus sp. BP-3]MDC2867518.1 hypothetical protein [Bacillus sp. BP-3]